MDSERAERLGVSTVRAGRELRTQIEGFVPAYADLPIVLVTTLASDESRRRGAEAGASAYLVKSAFDQSVLLETLKRLV